MAMIKGNMKSEQQEGMTEMEQNNVQIREVCVITGGGSGMGLAAAKCMPRHKRGQQTHGANEREEDASREPRTAV